ncbi:hypothetical protein D0T53_13005 [Dysgonomonas sp. 216]|uniref:hypothetical protein n=1 Tax=Dysgonomonas sp. 216 TaxID=2302934 RepID=UPI001C86D2EB|nr:hypothetical protein [Dysgonomonas sp. 216]NDW19819.1 hypothetical protein [Dysgonomonas sp. 216]
MLDTIKIILVAALGSLYSYLEPIYNPMKVLAIVFCADIVAGVLVDLIKNNDRIRIKKFLIAVAFLALYFSIIASTYVVGEHMGDIEEALLIVKTLTYIFSYFYISNTIRNLRLLAPQNKQIAFLDYWLGLQIVKRLPDLANFLGLSHKKQDNETDK